MTILRYSCDHRNRQHNCITFLRTTCVLLAMTALPVSGEIVYDNTTVPLRSATSAWTSYLGNEVELGGVARTVVKLFVGLSQSGGGTADFRVRFSLNDGLGGGPGTTIWESDVYEDVVLYDGTTLIEFPVPHVCVPDKFTWSLAIVDNPGPAIPWQKYGPPTVGVFRALWLGCCTEGSSALEARIVAVSDAECHEYCGDGICRLPEHSCNCLIDCGPPPTSEDASLTCNNGIDDDCDGTYDCADDDCQNGPACPGSCGNMVCGIVENACNCPIDCGLPPDTEIPSVSCDNLVDDDCDGLTDCGDPDCWEEPACPARVRIRDIESDGTIEAGNVYTIEWTDIRLGSARTHLDLYHDGYHVGFLSIVEESEGQFAWDVCTVIGNDVDYAIAVDSRWNGPRRVVTSPQFEIVGSGPKPTLTVTSPYWGQVWDIGSTHTIEWVPNNPYGTLRVSLNVLRPEWGWDFVAVLGDNTMAAGTLVDPWSIAADLEPGRYALSMFGDTKCAIRGGVEFALADPDAGDADLDGDRDLDDFAALFICMGGPTAELAEGCQHFNYDALGSIDLRDFAEFSRRFSGRRD